VTRYHLITASALASACSGEPLASTHSQVFAPIVNSSCLRATSVSASEASGARADPLQARCQVGEQKQSAKFHPGASNCGFKRGALFGRGKNRIDDCRMTGARYARRFVDDDPINRL